MSEYLKIILGGMNPVYPLIYSLTSIKLIKIILVLLFFLSTFYFILKKLDYLFDQHSWKHLVILVMAVTAIQCGIHLLAPETMGDVVKNPSANSFYTVPQLMSCSTYLKDFLTIRMGLPLHATSNMPGKSMLFYALYSIGNYPVIFSILLLILSNLGGLLVYSLSLHFYPSMKRGALYGALLYWFLPGKIFFFPLLNTVTPLFVLLTLFFLVRSIETGKKTWIFLHGLSLFTLFIFEPLPLATGLIHASLLIRSAMQSKKNLIRATYIAIGTFLSLLVQMLLFKYFTHFSSILVLRELLAVNSSFYEERVYSFWFFKNLFELLVCLSYGSFVILLLCMKSLFQPICFRLNSESSVYMIGFILTCFTLNALGVTRSEIIRLWIFLPCLIFPVLGPWISMTQKASTFRWAMGINLVHSLWAMQVIRFVGW